MSVKLSTLLYFGLALTLSFVFYISLPPAYSVSKERSHFKVHKSVVQNEKENNIDHNLAILVPFRDRFEELLEFAPHINKFLKNHNTKHHIFILNQVDSLRFNRASLLNAGFMELPITFDYIALHDVDLLPINPKLRYLYPSQGPYHVASPYLHPRYHYPTFIGGILLLQREHFRQVNGMSNQYWGWGLEDDEFYARLKEVGIDIYRPENFTSGTRNTFRHIHDRKIRRRDMIKCYNQQLITRKRDRQTGLSTTQYRVLSQKELTIDGAPVTVLNIVLGCNYSLTPWCNCTRSVGNTQQIPPQLRGASRTDVIVPKINRKIHIDPDG